MALSYQKSVDDRQPYGSYRIDVHSLKAGRRMTLFGKAALCQFIDLEADAEVTDICERPLIIPGLRPRKVVDFWALCGGVPTFHILMRPSTHRDESSWTIAYEQFLLWAAENGAAVIEKDPAGFDEHRIRYDNWSMILQHVISHRGQLTEHVFDLCDEAIAETMTLGKIENGMGDLDAMLVRAAVFSLLMRGSLKCASIDTSPISCGTKLERV